MNEIDIRRLDMMLLLVFASEEGPAAKLVVELDFARRLRGASGERRRQVFNGVKSGGVVPIEQLRSRTAYELIEGEV